MTAKKRGGSCKSAVRSPGRLVKPGDVKGMILFAANVFAVGFEVLESLEQGEASLPAVEKAVKKGKRRAKKIKEAEEDESED
jgi:hypothetical protein